MDLFQGLNPQQKKAITASDGPVLVLAGPGSGKTRVLTHRVAWLVLERDIKPWRIMAVTFTNKAAREMRHRLEGLLGHDQAGDLTLGTFHATCARILRREGEAIDIPQNYVIFDADDQRTLVRQILKELNLDDKKHRPPAIHAAISRAKNELISPKAYPVDSYGSEIVRRVYGLYQERLHLSGGLDFDDLLGETVRLFTEHPEILTHYQERYRHILVDEFQDTNMAQYILLRQLAAQNRNLFAVADEDQSIYLWRGADYRNIFRLREDYPDLATFLLEQNYRSTQTILDTAHAIIRHNPGRTEKQLFTQRESGTTAVVHEGYDGQAEAQFVVDTIIDLQQSAGISLGDCAVMYRTNAQSRVLEEAFLRAGLPYRLVGATRFYARREIKDMIAFLRIIHNPADSISLNRVINVPPRAIGQKTLQTLQEAAQAQSAPLWWAVEAVAIGDDQASPLGSRARNAVTAFHKLLCNWIDAPQQVTVLQLLDQVLVETAYEDYLRDGTEEGNDRWENVQELRTVAGEYDDLSLIDFLANVALVSDTDNMENGMSGATLLTLHSAKGLEFPVVFITGLEEGLLPHSRSINNPEELAEERRLMYVGVTRAKDHLYLTHTFQRTRYGSTEASTPSRFLRDIPLDLTTAGKSLVSKPAKKRVTSWTTRSHSTATLQFHTGDRVTHTTFGDGIVLESRIRGGDEEVSIIFDKVGLKRMMGSYLSKSKDQS